MNPEPYDHDVQTLDCQTRAESLARALKDLPKVVQVHIRGTVMGTDPIAVGNWQEKYAGTTYPDDETKWHYCGCLVTNSYQRSPTAYHLSGSYDEAEIADTLSEFYGVPLRADVMGEAAEAFDEWVKAERCLELGRYIGVGNNYGNDYLRLLRDDSPIRATLRDLFTTNDIGLPKEGN